MLHYLALFSVAGAVTLALTPVVRRWSLKRGLIDVPNARKVHTGEMSRLGGIAMFSGFAVAVGVQALGEASRVWERVLFGPGDGTWAVLSGMAVIFMVGVVDDLLSISPSWKFAGQVVAAGIVVAYGPRIEFVGNPFGGGLVFLGYLGIPVTLLWVIGFTNVINLIDGIDGLAAGVSAIAAGSFLVLAVQSNQTAAAVLAAALIGVCLGFLRYNFNPASIIMGDSGAMFLGFSLATMSLLGVMKSAAAITLAVPLLIIGVPVFDTASAIIRRARHGRPIQEADRGHIHHRLLGRGFNQRQTVLIIYVWSIALAFGGYAVRWAPSALRYGVFIVMAVLSAFMASWLGLFEAAHIHQDGE